MQAEVERHLRGVEHARNYASAMGCFLVEDEAGYDVGTRDRDEQGNLRIDHAKLTDEAVRQACGITYRELRSAKASLEALERYLGSGKSAA